LREYSPKGQATHERILSVSKKLFCSKGYRGTTYTDICGECKINPGTIFHHFKTKKNIAATIYNKLLETFYLRTEALFPGEDDFQQVILAHGMHHKTAYYFPEYRRFATEYANDATEADDGMPDGLDKPKKVVIEALGPEEGSFFIAVYAGMSGVIESYVDKHIDNLTFRESFDYMCRIYYSRIGGDDLPERIDRAYEDLCKIDIQFEQLDIIIDRAATGKAAPPDRVTLDGHDTDL